MKNVIIVGANGFLGYNLTKLLIEKGIYVYAVVNKNTDNLDNINSPLLKIFYNFDELKSEDTAGFGAMYYFVWEGNSGESRCDIRLQQNNILRSCLALRTAKDLGCEKFIFAGSIMEYEAFSSIKNQEITPGMGNIYSASKLSADIYLKTLAAKLDIPYITLLISNIYGPGEKNPRLVNMSIKKILNNEKTAFSTCTQLYDFIYIDDAVEKFSIIGDNGKYGGYYIGNPSPRELKQFILELGEVCGRSEADMGIGELGESTQLIDYSMVDTKRFENDFEYRNRISFKEGIKRTRQYLEKTVEY